MQNYCKLTNWIIFSANAEKRSPNNHLRERFLFFIIYKGSKIYQNASTWIYQVASINAGSMKQNDNVAVFFIRIKYSSKLI